MSTARWTKTEFLSYFSCRENEQEMAAALDSLMEGAAAPCPGCAAYRAALETAYGLLDDAYDSAAAARAVVESVLASEEQQP